MGSRAAAAAYGDSLSAYLNDANSRSGAASSFAPLRGASGDVLAATSRRATGAELLTAACSAPAGTPVQQQQPHATLLATPLSRTAGGKLGRAAPQPSLLDQYMNNVASSAARLGTSAGKQPQQVAASTLTARFTPRGAPSPLRQPLFGNAAAGTTAAGLAPPLSVHKADLAAQLKSIDLAVARSNAVLATSTAAAAGAMPPASTHSDFRIHAVRTTPARTGGRAGNVAAGPAGATGDWSINIRLTASPRHGSSSALGAISDAASISARSPASSPAGSATSRSVAERIAALQLGPGALSSQQQQQVRASPLAPNSKAAGHNGVSDVQTLLSRINQLEAQVRARDMQLQEVTAETSDLQQRLVAAEQRAEKQADSLSVSRQLAARAEAQRAAAEQEATAMREEAGRRASAHADNTEAVTRLQAVSEVQRRENDELREEVRRLSKLLDEQLSRGAALQASLLQSQSCASSSASAMQHQVEALESAHRRQLEEAAQRMAAETTAQDRRCQLLEIELAAARQEAEAARQEAADGAARWQEQQQALVAVRHAELDADERAAALDGVVRSLQGQLAAAQEQARRAEEALEQERRRAGSQSRHTSAVQQSEAALTAQLRAMAGQLQQLQADVASLRSEKAELENRLESVAAAARADISAAEAVAAAATAERDEAAAALGRARDEAARQAAAVEEQRSALKQLQRANAELQSVVREHEAAIMARNQQLVSLQAEAEGRRTEVARLSQALQDAKAAAAAAEDRLARAGRGGLGGASPLREMLDALQSELAEREAALAQAQEDLGRERGRAADLQRQLLAQAVELDDAQRELSDTIASKQALATAQATEAGLRRRLAELQQQLGAAASGSSGGGGGGSPAGAAAALQRELAAAQEAAAAARRDAERLREECEARELEVMQLQGQVRLLQQQATEAESWLMSPG